MNDPTNALLGTLRRSLNRLVRGLQLLPSLPLTKDRYRALSKPFADNVLNLCRKLGIEPKMLVDVGARNSEFAFWIARRFPQMSVESFEPVEKFSPIGRMHLMALSDEDMPGLFDDGKIAQLGSKGKPVIVRRFDSLSIPLTSPALLKIDAENSTFNALLGFGSLLSRFDLVIVETVSDLHPDINDLNPGQTADVWKYMVTHGFNRSEIVCASWDCGRIIHADVAFWKAHANHQTKHCAILDE